MISLPPELQPILAALWTHKITPIVVGGYVRDALLNIHSKDIDIELYNTPVARRIGKDSQTLWQTQSRRQKLRSHKA